MFKNLDAEQARHSYTNQRMADMVGISRVNIASCYYNSSNGLLYIKGHNFGVGTCIALANVFVLYKKN